MTYSMRPNHSQAHSHPLLQLSFFLDPSSRGLRQHLPTQCRRRAVAVRLFFQPTSVLPLYAYTYLISNTGAPGVAFTIQ